ncbi:MAG: hypothetical protein AAGG44_02070 [Planctomycetota bacterium]
MFHLRTWLLQEFIMFGRSRASDLNRIAVYAGWLAIVSVVDAVLPTSAGLAHELKDGVVERDLQVVVFPDRAEFQYSFEMNFATMRKLFEGLKSDKTLPDDERAAWDAFRKVVASSLSEKIEVSIGGKRRHLKLKSSETIEKHSIKIAHVFVCDFTPEEKAQTIDLHDKNFAKAPGYHRVALKGRRGIQIEESTAPIIVSQQLRNAWEKMSAKDRESRVHIRALLGLKNST